MSPVKGFNLTPALLGVCARCGEPAGSEGQCCPGLGGSHFPKVWELCGNQSIWSCSFSSWFLQRWLIKLFNIPAAICESKLPNSWVGDRKCEHRALALQLLRLRSGLSAECPRCLLALSSGGHSLSCPAVPRAAVATSGMAPAPPGTRARLPTGRVQP